MRQFLFAVLGACSILQFGMAAAAPSADLYPTPVQVTVDKVVRARDVQYRYVVSNGSSFPIRSFILGAPVSRNLIRLSAESPRGWIADVQGSEADSGGALKWAADSTAAPAVAILGGQTAGGFTVTVSQEDSTYLVGAWTVHLNSDEPASYSGSLSTPLAGRPPPAGCFAQSGIRLAIDSTKATLQISVWDGPRDEPIGEKQVTVYDAFGKKLWRALGNTVIKPPATSRIWSGQDANDQRVGPGTYFVRVKDRRGERFAKFSWLERRSTRVILQSYPMYSQQVK